MLNKIEREELSFEDLLNTSKNLYDKGNFNQCIKTLDTLKNKFSEEWNKGFHNLNNAKATCYIKIGKYNHALEILNLVHKKYPNSEILLNNISLCHLKTNSYNKALKYINLTLNINPNSSIAYLNKGMVYSQLNNTDEALTYFKKSIKLDSKNAEACNNLANELNHLGINDLAQFYYEQSLKIKPKNAIAHRNLANLKKFTDQNDKQIKLIKENIKDPKISQYDLPHYYFSLGKAYEDMKYYKLSYENYLKGNLIYKKQLRYNIQNDINLFKDLSYLFSKDKDFNHHKKISSNIKLPIFILGMPRSGTSLLEQMLSCHSDIYGGGELSYTRSSLIKSNILKTDLSLNIKNLNKNSLNTFSKSYFENIKKINFSQKYFTDKMNSNFRWIGFLISSIKNVKIIHLKRDARATSWSIFKHFFSSGGHPYSHDMNDIVQYFNAYNKLMRDWKRLFPKRFYTLEYEKLVENPEHELKKVFNYIGLPWDPVCLEFYKSKRAVKTASVNQVREKIFKNSSKKWESYKPYVLKIFNNLQL